MTGRFLVTSRTWNLCTALGIFIGGAVQIGRSCVGPGLCALFVGIMLLGVESVWCISAFFSWSRWEKWDEFFDTVEGYTGRGIAYILVGVLLTVSHDIQYGCWGNIVFGILLCTGGCGYLLVSRNIERSIHKSQTPIVNQSFVTTNSALLSPESVSHPE